MQNRKNIKLVATDLDGTFLRDDLTISNENLESLHLLGEKGILRVAATGRNLKKTRDVIPMNIPFDFIVFSSGAGIYDWQNNKLVFYQNLPQKIVKQLIDFLIEEQQSFHLFKPVPDNHCSWYYRGNQTNPEFEQYFGFQNSASEEITKNSEIISDACQFLIILPDDITRFEKLKTRICEQFPDVKIVRTTSPLNTGYIWMELFHQDVSKGNGVQFLCTMNNIAATQTLGIGNDYNDIDLLGFTEYSYLVENSPAEMKKLFATTMSNQDHAFAHTILEHLR